MKKFALIISLLFVSAVLFSQDSYVRFPAVSPDGKTLCFNFQGDLWTMPVNGVDAKRITIHEAYESNPKWSPDGTKIAFSSNRFGNNDIFITDSKGGFPKRITWHSTNDVLSDWTNSDILLFESNRNYRQVEWESETHQVSSKGGTPDRFFNGLGKEARLSPDGKYIAFTIGECRIEREQYKGSANKDIWIYDIKNNSYNQITDHEGQDFHPVWSKGNMLYFISARSGKYNIFHVQINNSGNIETKAKQITKVSDFGIRSFDVDKNNSFIIYEKDINLYKISTQGDQLKKLNINISTDYRFDPYENKVFRSQTEQYKVSPNGKYSAFIVHGELFITENDKEKSLTRNLSKSVFREKDVTWLNDSVIIFSSDRDESYNLYSVKSKDKSKGDLLKTLKHEVKKLTKNTIDEHSPIISPDKSKILFIRGGEFGKNKLLVADIDKSGTIKNEKVLIDGWNAPSGIKWSPDSKWIAYSVRDLTFNSEIFIQSISTGLKPVNISMHPRSDYSPVWSDDGSKLGFISDRNNLNNDIWFVWLNKSDYQKTKEDWKEESGKKDTGKKPEKKDGKSDKKEITPIKIDFENIHERLVQVTSLSGNEGNLAVSKDGKTFYFSSSSPGVKGRDLFEIKWDGTKIKQVTKGGKSPNNVKFDSQYKFLYFLSKGKINRKNVKGQEIENIPFEAKMTINFKEELNQVFDEAWRSLRDGFYDPEYHGQNWDDLKKKYKPMCMSASTKTDFIYMFNLMLGQLNASHMGLYGKDREQTQREVTGLLGIIIKPNKNGVLIEKIITDSPADKNSSKLFKGEIITEVNGYQINDKVNFWSLMINSSKSKVLLKVKNQKGNEREVIIRPTENLRRELYNEWVKERRRLTEKYSGGKLGYLHIRGMDMPSFERFERELTAAGYGKKAIVIDVRFNGGGWTTDYLMAILNVKQHAYTIPRGATESLKNNNEFSEFYPFAERLPFFVWNKPSITICNSASYSNAEIFSHAYKNLGIGTLVGEPTFGAVISTSGLGLIDGSFVRMPFRAWFVKKDNKNMETDAAIPDVLIKNSIDFKAKNEDEQLQKACEILLKQISK